MRPAKYGGQPQEEMMRFKSRDLMMDVLPAAKRFTPGLVLCGQATAGGGRRPETMTKPKECGQATARAGGRYHPRGGGLALLRQQLHESLSLR